jgi:TonB family protein
VKFSFGQALVLSVAAHAVLYGGAQGYMDWRRHRSFEAMDIDLSRSSLMPLPANMALLAAKPPEDWFVGDGRRLAPPPAPVPLSQTAKPEAEAMVPACPPPCPSAPGDWIPASQSIQKPVWEDGMISEDDYPEQDRIKNITGQVVVQVLLDESGAVRAVSLLQGSDKLLNDKTLEKVRQARFSPCVDSGGKPFPCVMTLPILWNLD